MNVIYIMEFTAAAQHGGGGKSLFGGSSQVTGYEYYATWLGAIGEGIIIDLIAIFDGQEVYTPTTLPAGKSLTFFQGTSSQAPWTVVVDNKPDDAFAYKDTCYVGGFGWPLGPTPTIPQMNFIPEGKFSGTFPLNLYTAPDGSEYLFDADPALVIEDFLTNVRYGAGFPPALLDTSTLFTSAAGLDPLQGDAALSTYCQAVGLGWSIVLNNSEPGRSILERWCRNLGVAPVWTGATLKFLPYSDAFSGANPGYDAAHASVGLKYYNPASLIQTLFDLTDADFIQTEEDEDPVVMSRVDVSDVKSIVRIDFRNRFNMWNPDLAEAKDEVTTEKFGFRIDSIGMAEEFNHLAYASVAAQLRLQRNIAIRRTFRFKLPMVWCILDPMDVVTITDATLQLSQFPVRIRSIEEDEDGNLEIEAEEFPLGSATATLYPREENTPPDFSRNIPPPDVNEPLIFEPTAQFLAAQSVPSPTIRIAVSGGPAGVFSSNWGGANVWVSNDNVTYVNFGVASPAARMGALSANLASYIGSNPDNVNTLSVDLGESNGSLESVTAVQAAAGLSICVIEDPDGCIELLSYTTATLTGANQYNLTGLYRGLYGTAPVAHLSGANFARVDDWVIEGALPSEFINTTIYFKFQSFNIWGNLPQDLSGVTAYPYEVKGWGTDYDTNPIIGALLLGQNVDLNGMSTSLDLNSGGDTECGVTVFDVDLEELAA